MRLFISFLFCVCCVQRAITLSQQLGNYKEYQSKVAMVVGDEEAGAIVANGLHILSCGTGDYLRNYYINPGVRRRFTPYEYSSFLVASFSKFIKVPFFIYLLHS